MSDNSGTAGTSGKAGFAETHGLRNDADARLIRDILRRIDADGIEAVRLVFADQHGILRGKTLLAGEIPSAFDSGCTITTTLLAKDTSHKTVYPVFTEGGGFGLEEMTGAGDFVLLPDPETFRVLPWAPDTGWLLCDIYFPTGQAVPFSTRRMLDTALSGLADAGYDYVSGLEVEFYVFKMEDPKLEPIHATQPATPPDVSLLAHGFQYLTELRQDELEPVLAVIRKQIVELGIPLRSVEVEFGPSQVEMTFAPQSGRASADTMVLFRSAVKQICRRNGWHATFMCRPALPNLFSSGWHLHQSFVDRKTGDNAFVPGPDDTLLSQTGRFAVAGILEHAAAASVFTTPTLNGYKRFQPYSLAPDRAAWSPDNRGAMLRIVSGEGDPGSRIENRIGEPAANPYLYLSSQIFSALDGLEKAVEPPPPTETPYEAEGTPLPNNLGVALDALEASDMFRSRMGSDFVDYIATIKRAEIARFMQAVTDWEQREYFEIF